METIMPMCKNIFIICSIVFSLCSTFSAQAAGTNLVGAAYSFVGVVNED
jgi:hypothetical protein